MGLYAFSHMNSIFIQFCGGQMGCISIKFVIVLLFTLLPVHVYSQHVIVHSENETTSLSKNTLKSIFSMRLRTWPDGTPITVFVQNPDSETHRKFCLSKLGVLPYQIQRTWDVLVFSGMGQSPIELANEIEMKQKIGQIRGAIGYVSNIREADNVIPISIY